MIKKIIKTDMFNRYMVKFFLRIMVFVLVFFIYIMTGRNLIEFLNERLCVEIIGLRISALDVLWLMFMIMMLVHLFPDKKRSMALRKVKENNYSQVNDYSRTELLEFVQEQNVRAWIVMLVWLSFNAIWGILYLFKVIGNDDLLMLTVFYFLCDYICILIYCPFQTYIMKNRCCVNCRIYDWGHFMMFTPMLFIKNFYSWSLFFTSLIVLIHWEIVYARYPYRFWSGSNKTLQCANCKDKTCQIKKRIKA